MNLSVLLALKIAHDQQQAIERRRRRMEEEARRKRNAPKDKNHQYSSKEYSESEYFYKVISEDEILKEFFKALVKKGEEIDNNDAEEIRKIIEEKLKLQAERVEKIDEAFNKIKQTKLDVIAVEEYFSNQTTVGQKVLDAGKPAFGGKGEYAKIKKYFELEYNGIRLEREWFKGNNKSVNPFEKRFTDWKNKNPDIEEKIASQEKAIKTQERKVKFALFGKEEKEEELKNLNMDLEKLKETRLRGEIIKSHKEAFAKITPKQKDLIEKYFEIVDECKVAGKDVDLDIAKYGQIKEKSSYRSYNSEKSAKERNKWQKAIDSLINEGDVSEELLESIDTILSEESIGYEKYFEGKDRYTMSREGYSEDFMEIISWYIDTRREKIALKGVERREEAYTALAAEHTRLLEVAGLVDKATSLEESLKKPEKGDEEYGD